MAASNKRVKVLISGPINGQLTLLSNKLSTLNNSKAGPFDICVCCGPFFYSSNAASTGSSTAAVSNNKVAGDEEAADKVDNEQTSQIEAAANNDATKLKNGTIKFDIPVLFVDVGDSLPAGLDVEYPKVTDDAEIDLDDDDEDEVNEKEKGEDDNEDKKEDEKDKVPDGLLRIAPNLYQLIGSSPNNIADIISVPLPLKDPTIITSTKREHPTALTIGYLPKNTRLSTQTQTNNNFTTKSQHTSFLGCDILISTEWGQGMCDLKVGALSLDDRTLLNGSGGGGGSGGSGEGGAGGQGIEIGSYDVAELVAMSRPRYHIAPGPIVPVQQPQQKQDDSNDTKPPQIKLHQRFMASLPYRYPPTSSTSGSSGTSSSNSHAGRFLAMGSIQPPTISKALGKSFKYIHAVGIVPLAYMDSNDRENAKELDKVVDCPYTDASYGVDTTNIIGGRGGGGNMMNYGGMNGGGIVGGLSEARARRLAQEDAASNMNNGGGQGPGGAFRWQQRGRKRPLNGEDGPGSSGMMNEEEAKRQAIEASNPDNTSLFLHGLHRDPSGMTLTNDAIMNSFKPFGCIGIRFPKPKMNHRQSHYQNSEQRPSYAFLDFNTHEEALQCLADLNGEVAVCNVMLTLKWSSSGKSHQQPQMHHQGQQQGNNMGMMPQRRQRNRLTEQEAGDSTTLFLRLPTSINSSDYPAELETMRSLGQGTMEDELNVGVPLDSTDRITANDEPALRVTVRQPTAETNYGFLEFASHTAALTTIVALTGNDDGGRVSEDKLTASCLITDDMKKKDISHLSGVTLYWAKGSSQPKPGNGGGNNYGLKFNKQHFPPDSRTDCWFCLASPACEKHLIVAVYEECYVALPKGGVNEHHALIVPVEHGGDGALVNRKLSPEIESVKSKLRLHARTVLNKDLFVFERCIATKGGYHTHVQCIPVDANSGPTIQSKMLDMASRVGFQLKEITSDLGLNALEDDWSDGYFYAEIPLPGGGDEFRRFIYRAGGEGSGGADNNNGGRRGPTVPLQFGREVLAEVMDNPDIGQWKACVVSKEKEEELTIAFRKSLSSVSS